MFGWGRAFLSSFSLSCFTPSWYQPCCLANQEYLNTFLLQINRLVALLLSVHEQVLQLFPLGALAQHLPLELKEGRKTKEDQEQKRKVFSSPWIDCQPSFESTNLDIPLGLVLHKNHLFLSQRNIQLKTLAALLGLPTYASVSSTCSVFVSWFALSLEQPPSPQPQARDGPAITERAKTNGRTFFT